MKCPGCGYENLDLFETCKYCGPPLVAGAAAPDAPATDPADDVLSLRFEPERSDPGQGGPGHRRRRTTPGIRADRGGDFVEMFEDDDAPPFRIDDDLFLGYEPGAPDVTGTAPGSADRAHHHEGYGVGAERSGPAVALPDEEQDPPADVEAIIDRHDEVPERYWAPEVAGLGRRALALLVDQGILMAVLGIFLLGALVALRHNNLTTGLFLPAGGVQASALPFALLAALLSLAYSSFFHGITGRTPGKALVGIEVRTGVGGSITWSRAILRWLGAALGLACAGVGIVWALFEPRRRGWADLISGTVVARPQRVPALEASRR